MYCNLSFVVSLCFLFLDVGTGALGFTPIIYNGFKSDDPIAIDGIATISDGLLRLTNDSLQKTGHAFYRDPVPFKQSRNGSVLSFSTTFVFEIVSEFKGKLSGHGLVFVIAPSRGLPYSLPKQHLGLFNETNNGKSTNHVVGVEMDTIEDAQFNDINNNHVGIDINNLTSVESKPAAYYINATSNVSIPLHDAGAVQVWIEYDGHGPNMRLDVTLAPINISKPLIPLISFPLDLSPILYESMYIGFSSATGSMNTSHYVRGWSFALNATAPSLDIATLPKLPNTTIANPPQSPPSSHANANDSRRLMFIILPIAISALLIMAICFWVFYAIQRRKRFTEELEDWESEYGPHRFKYKDLYVATKGFQDKELLGTGGFGKVYKGVLPNSNTEVAVKKVAHDSRQGMREFVAEIVSLGRLRHRNLVQLLGYCRRKGELLLVYEYMPNGSLDKFLHHNNITVDPIAAGLPAGQQLTLDWSQRFNVIKGVAAGLLYLHEEWEQVVVHRDIKASNVLLDSELNGRLSDFGLARLHERGGDPRTTHVMGTLGYLAPEHPRTGKATPSTDVYAFGAFLLEVVCGRRPIDLQAPRGEAMLVDTVFGCWKRGVILMAVDRRLKGEYDEEEAERALKLGLLCSNLDAEDRPTMRDAVAYLDQVVPMPELEGLELGPNGVSFGGKRLRSAMEGARTEGARDLPVSYTSSFNVTFTRSSSIAESQLSQGR